MLAHSIPKPDTTKVDCRDIGFIPGGVAATNSTNLNAGITSLSAAGGGTIVVPAGTYQIGATITLKKLVYLLLRPGATIKWAGTAGGTVFTSLADRVLVLAGVSGGTIALENASIGFDLHSHQYCNFEHLYLTNNDPTKTYSATSILFKIRADSTTNTDSLVSNLKNTMGNVYNDIHHGDQISLTQACGTVISMGGEVGVGVTLNTFKDIMSHNCYAKGIEITQWADDNDFTGMIRINLYGNNSIGVDMLGSLTVYCNSFFHLAIDTFTHPGVPDYSSFTGRKGIRLGNVRHIKVENYYNTPMTDVGGSSFQDAGAQSYYIVFHDYQGAGSPMRLISKNLQDFGGTITATEIDGAPSVAANTIKFPNGSVTDLGGGVVSVAFSDSIDGGTFNEVYTYTANIDGGAF